MPWWEAPEAGEEDNATVEDLSLEGTLAVPEAARGLPWACWGLPA